MKNEGPILDYGDAVDRIFAGCDGENTRWLISVSPVLKRWRAEAAEENAEFEERWELASNAFGE